MNNITFDKVNKNCHYIIGNECIIGCIRFDNDLKQWKYGSSQAAINCNYNLTSDDLIFISNKIKELNTKPKHHIEVFLQELKEKWNFTAEQLIDIRKSLIGYAMANLMDSDVSRENEDEVDEWFPLPEKKC